MEGLSEIATTGAPGIVTAMGMGTVFTCLILLYGITRAMGSGLPRLIALGEPKKSVESPAPVSEDELVEDPQPQAADVDGIAAAIALALARHRTARAPSVPEDPKKADPWKIAGRMHTLRDR